MSQYLRPDATLGGDSIFGRTSGSLYSCIDETSPSDSDYIWSNNGVSGTSWYSMSDPGNVGSGTCTLRVRYAKSNAGTLTGSGATVRFRVLITQDTTTIASSSYYYPTGTWTTTEWSPDLSAITDWTAVRTYISCEGGTDRGVAVSWLELEVPDPIYEESFSESVTVGDSYAVTVAVNATITEDTNMSDVLTAGIPYFNSITETVTLTDSLSSGILWGDVINETVVMDDSYTMRVVEPNGWEIPADPEETWNVSGGDGGGDWQEIYKPDAEWNEE